MHASADDIDVEEVLDVEEFDDLLARTVNPLALAFECSEDLGSSFRHLMADMLRQFLGTHRSVILLMKNSEENPASMADAMSLAREQVEKVYAVALLLEDPGGVDRALPQGCVAQELRAAPDRCAREERSPALRGSPQSAFRCP